MSQRDVRITLRDRQTTGGSIPSSALFGEPFINIFDGVLRFSGVTGGSFEPSTQPGIFEVGSILYNQKITNRLNVNNNFIISGDTGFISTYGGITGAGLSGKFLSGTTNGFVLGNIADIQGVTTRVQPGVNTYTGGTPDAPTVNVVNSPSFNNITYSGTSVGGNSIATNVSATTFYSAGTNLESIISTLATGTVDITRVQPGSNITTGGTGNLPIINLAASPSINNLSFSGTATGGNIVANSLTANTANVTTLSATTFSSTTAIITTLSATTFYSGGTSLETIIQNIAGGDEDITRVQPGSNITTGGTGNLPIVNLTASPSINNLSFSGTATGGNIIANSLSATTISGGTIYSGGTNLSNIFSQLGSSVQTVTAGSNILVGGTATNPIVSVVGSPSFNGISFSGTGTGNILNTQILTATAITDSNLTSGQAVYAGTGGLLKTNSGFTYDELANRVFTQNIQIGSSSLSGQVTIWGDVTVMGQSISAFTSQLYIEDNNVSLNYNPTASTTSTSLGAGWTIQDGSGLGGTDVFFDIRGTATGLANRSFATNLEDIRIRESGTVSSPNGVRVIAEFDILDGGAY